MITAGNLDSYAKWLFPLFGSLWVIFSLATVSYMRVVFKRYETTRALPIEYGTVNICNFCSGMLYFDESRTMDTWQIALGLVGLCFLVAGIFIGQLDELLKKEAKPGESPKKKYASSDTDVQPHASSV